MSTIVRRSALGLAIASLVVGAGAPAFARPAAPAAFADGSTMTLDQATGKYCLTEKATGSHIPVVTCQTRSDWAKDGLTISTK